MNFVLNPRKMENPARSTSSRGVWEIGFGPSCRDGLRAAILRGFRPRRQAVDVALVAVAFIHTIAEQRAVGQGFDAAVMLEGAETREEEPLVQAADRFANVAQFAVDGMLHFAHAHDQANDQQSGDQDEFGGHDKTGVIVPKLFQHVVCYLEKNF
jgi:hypothetical protein